MAIQPLGFPSPDGQSVYMSKSDMADIVRYTVSLQNWIVVASTCLEGR